VGPSQANPPLGPLDQARHVAFARRATQSLFLTFVTLALIFPSLKQGPLNWLPIVQMTAIDQAPIGLGPLSLLPGLAVTAWILARAVERPVRPWQWGRPGITLPLIGLTLLMLLSLEPTVSRRTMLVVLALGLLWWVYLFTLNEAPGLTVPLTVVIIVQSSVALGQFASQGDLGLQMLGEPVLDPERSGTCVLLARGQRWLRAYGLSGHPNLLGALLSILLLVIIDDVAEARGWAQAWFTLAASAGLVGLLTTFSRSAWLAFGLGLLCWLARNVWHDRPSLAHLQELVRSRGVRLWRRYTQFIIPIVMGAGFLLLHHDLVTSRFLHLDTPIESRSITDRQTDANLAVELIKGNPWRGVGVNNYLVAVRAIEPDSRTVHNVVLLTAAELGLPGAALWLWLALRGLARPLSPAWAPWIVMVVTSLFDVALFPTNSWYAAIVFGLLAAHASFPLRNEPERPGLSQVRASMHREDGR